MAMSSVHLLQFHRKNKLYIYRSKSSHLVIFRAENEGPRLVDAVSEIRWSFFSTSPSTTEKDNRSDKKNATGYQWNHNENSLQLLRPQNGVTEHGDDFFVRLPDLTMGKMMTYK